MIINNKNRKPLFLLAIFLIFIVVVSITMLFIAYYHNEIKKGILIGLIISIFPLLFTAISLSVRTRQKKKPKKQ
jgi:hypothetical protein